MIRRMVFPLVPFHPTQKYQKVSVSEVGPLFFFPLPKFGTFALPCLPVSRSGGLRAFRSRNWGAISDLGNLQPAGTERLTSRYFPWVGGWERVESLAGQSHHYIPGRLGFTENKRRQGWLLGVEYKTGAMSFLAVMPRSYETAQICSQSHPQSRRHDR